MPDATLSGPVARTPADLPGVRRLEEISFLSDQSDRGWERLQALYAEMPGYVVRDGDAVVAHAGAFAFSMSLPGGVRPVAGVTAVSVLATHRRRGLLRSLMRRQLDDLHEAGTSVAALWASESAIYGRFGYGQASRLARATVPRAHRGLRPVPGTEGVRVELLEMPDAEGGCREAYERAVPLRPGMVHRSDALHAYVTADEPSDRGGASRLRCALARNAVSGEVRGYAWFSLQPEWGPRGAEGTAVVRELIGLDPPATAALLAFLLDLDLTAQTRFGSLPVDHPLFALLVEPRRSAPVVGDQLWVRLVDVGAALASRAYTVPVDLRIEVRDSTCPWNDGVWALTGGPDGARCERAPGAPADLTLDVRELGAAYLGDGSLAAAAVAGLVDERTPGAVGHAATAFAAHGSLPWIPFIF